MPLARSAVPRLSAHSSSDRQDRTIRSVAQTITQEDLNLLREYNEKMAEMAYGGDFHTFGDWNEKFHVVCISKYPNRSLRGLCDTVRRLLYTFPVRHDSFEVPEFWYQMK